LFVASDNDILGRGHSPRAAPTTANAKSAFAGDPDAVPHEHRRLERSQARASLPNQARTGLAWGPAYGPRNGHRQECPFGKLRAGLCATFFDFGFPA
jgi:hypothetical protein